MVRSIQRWTRPLANLPDLADRDQTDPRRMDRSLRPAQHPKLAEDAVDVTLDGLLSEAETARDLLVGFPSGHPAEHLDFAGRIAACVRLSIPSLPRMLWT